MPIGFSMKNVFLSICTRNIISSKWVNSPLKRLFTNFEYITFFLCPTERNIFYKRFISIKPLWLEIIEKKGCTKSVRVIYMIYITVLGRTDFVHPLFSIISSQSGFIEMDLLQKMFLLVGHEKNVIYSKFVNNPFKSAATIEMLLIPTVFWVYSFAT